AIAAKSLKEASYHVRWSAEWVIRLGDGTEESKKRIEKAITQCWQFTGELFDPASFELALMRTGIAADVQGLKNSFDEKVKNILDEATLRVPEGIHMQSGGKEGKHTEQLGYILAEMQFLQRVYPGCEW
ncbi:MAG TPA: 1,2-phenylacetyl-CoA epoxidase subunit PaaC, partial [Flavitalea sp.]|nr:1,2-phenylacetyl-CoA epoxidase subunit PaaC [Flavitalea sp.]